MVAAVSARTPAQSGRQVAWLRAGQRYTPATVKHLQRTGTTAVGCRLKTHKEESECVSHRISARTGRGDASSQARGHVGDPILTTHGIPLPSGAQAAGVTVGEEGRFLIRQAFHSARDTEMGTHSSATLNTGLCADIPAV